MPEELAQSLPLITALAKEAGTAILKYQGLSSAELNVTKKQDNTLLTEADLQAHEILCTGLQEIAPEVPVLSEEGAIAPYTERNQWSRYWLLDPLDGTRGFVERSDEFTVNIALIEERHPILGVVYVPKQECCYFALKDLGAFKQVDEKLAEPIHVRQMNWKSFRVLLGHYLHSSRLPKLFKNMKGCEIVRINSSLKFCSIAEGKGDFYPRLGETSEWDTAAAQCILEEAGGIVVDLNGQSLQYNAKNSLTNPPFAAIGDPKQKNKIIKLVKEKKEKK